MFAYLNFFPAVFLVLWIEHLCRGPVLLAASHKHLWNWNCSTLLMKYLRYSVLCAMWKNVPGSKNSGPSLGEGGLTPWNFFLKCHHSLLYSSGLVSFAKTDHRHLSTTYANGMKETFWRACFIRKFKLSSELNIELLNYFKNYQIHQFCTRPTY